MVTRARWAFAHALYGSALEVLGRAALNEREAQPVTVYGPDGKTTKIPRALAERLVQRRRLKRAPDDVMRQELGLPPRIVADVSQDHTALAGALDPEPATETTP